MTANKYSQQSKNPLSAIFASAGGEVMFKVGKWVAIYIY